jgi:hypothetical protein
MKKVAEKNGCTCGKGKSGKGKSSKGGNWKWWVAGAVALVMASGGGGLSLGQTTGHTPAKTNAPCTQYFKGGC